jgi:hypothetical protein
MAQGAGLGVPEAADHVIGDAGDRRTVGRRGHVADPLRVRLNRANALAPLQVPPDQLAVVASRDGPAGSRHGQAGHIAVVAMIPQGMRLRFLHGHVHVVDPEVGAAEDQALCTGHPRQGEDDLIALQLLDESKRGRG